MLTRRQVIVTGSIAALIPSVGAASDQVLTPTDANAKMQDGSLILVDVRTPVEWLDTGVAQGAWLLDMTNENFFAYMKAVLDRNPTKQVAVICHSGNRSGRVYQALQDAGYSRVWDVDQGMSGGPRGKGWIKTGLPIVDARSAYDAMPKDLTATPSE